ncbi:hypothetical protein [Streptomyces sp. B1I3]|uniref:hypothetical protein n=1 Tax=Streptomyces sp. B1I3 TaxID=3042264 RepID=UPI0027805988|nr:hypothetical protein [Streptomyces sp. B1I3]MDQ0797853.1 hypothetical protein [Streptomyces sp. B1I3]
MRGDGPPIPRTGFDEVAAAAGRAAHGLLNACAVLAPDVRAPALMLPAVHDGHGAFPQMYGARDGEAFLVRPDGHLGLRAPAEGPGRVAHLELLLGT